MNGYTVDVQYRLINWLIDQLGMRTEKMKLRVGLSQVVCEEET